MPPTLSFHSDRLISAIDALRLNNNMRYSCNQLPWYFSPSDSSLLQSFDALISVSCKNSIKKFKYRGPFVFIINEFYATKLDKKNLLHYFET